MMSYRSSFIGIGLLIHMQVLKIPDHIKICSGNIVSLNKSFEFKEA